VTAAEAAGRALREGGEASEENQTALTTFALARSEAEQDGLTEAERQLAIIIGLYRSKQNTRHLEDRRDTSSIEPPPLPDEVDEPAEPADDTPMLRLAIYLRLVQLGEADSERGEVYPLGFLTHVGLTVLDAQNYGLRREEIQAALQIGAFRRNRQQTSLAVMETPQDISVMASYPIFAAPRILGQDRHFPIPKPAIF
jgi:hypothetical protein